MDVWIYNKLQWKSSSRQIRGPFQKYCHKEKGQNTEWKKKESNGG